MLGLDTGTVVSRQFADWREGGNGEQLLDVSEMMPP